VKPESRESSDSPESPDLVVRGASWDPGAPPVGPAPLANADSPESDSPDLVVQLAREAFLALGEALELLGLAGSQALQAALDLPDSRLLRALGSPGCLEPVVAAARQGLLVRPVLLGLQGDALSAQPLSRQLELPVAAASPSRPSTSGGSTGRRR